MAGNKDILIFAQFGKWSNWYPIQSYIGKHKYTVSYSFRDSPMEMPFEVQIKYMDGAKTSVVTTLGPGSHIVEGDGAGSDYIRLHSLSFGFGSVAVTVPN
ncbi:colicin Z C-terminal domain-related protein [Providencia rettgeri]|uniref:colicin Z C-terminal domain-related protein n=1 Tax=Providencia rettgeri TaxID=587 RepID=UPI00235F84FB|nr:colicin Z C-terminal domain-related protein [Providencia rettgeri]